MFIFRMRIVLRIWRLQKPTQTPNETKIDIYNCILHICNALHGTEFTTTTIVEEMEIITQLYCKMIIFAHCSN